MPRQVKPLQATASTLNRLVQIQQKSGGTDDGAGGKMNIVWQTLPGCGLVPARIQAMNGYEQFTAQQLYPGVNTRIALRWRRSQNIDASMRVVFGTRIFNIRSIRNIDESDSDLELRCEELQAKGSNS